MNIIGKRKIWYGVSALLLVPGLIALAVFGLKLGIDFAGGTVLEVTNIETQQAREVAGEVGIDQLDVRTTESSLLLRFQNQDPGTEGNQDDQPSQTEQIKTKLEAQGAKIIRTEVVGPSISRNITQNAFLSIGIMSLAIVAYVAFSFRHMPPPVKSVTFGITAIIALIHDSLFVIGVFAVLGRALGIEIDAYFVTAILTVIGFSVHDTIVVFDRIRENLQRYSGSFTEIVNRSVNEVLVRSLNTSFVILLVLMALFLFGGESIQYFILALLLGMVSGTYSSIFLASPLLVEWRNFQKRRASRQEA